MPNPAPSFAKNAFSTPPRPLDEKWILCRVLIGRMDVNVGLSDNVTYVVEDITSGDVSKYKYTLNFNPKMWVPVEADVID